MLRLNLLHWESCVCLSWINLIHTINCNCPCFRSAWAPRTRKTASSEWPVERNKASSHVTSWRTSEQQEARDRVRERRIERRFSYRKQDDDLLYVCENERTGSGQTWRLRTFLKCRRLRTWSRAADDHMTVKIFFIWDWIQVPGSFTESYWNGIWTFWWAKQNAPWIITNCSFDSFLWTKKNLLFSFFFTAIKHKCPPDSGMCLTQRIGHVTNLSSEFFKNSTFFSLQKEKIFILNHRIDRAWPKTSKFLTEAHEEFWSSTLPVIFLLIYIVDHHNKWPSA